MFKKGVLNIFKDQKGQARLQSLARSNSGQALLIIVLVMVVALTVGLSLASRTITNIRNTREQASSQKALSAAEAGIEQAIKSGASIGQTTLSNNATYQTTVTQVLATLPFLLNGGGPVVNNDATYIWVTPYSSNPANLWQNPWSGNLSVYWGNSGQSCSNASNMPAAIEISVISGSVDAPVMTRYVYDPCVTRRGSNNFSSPTSSTPVTVSGTALTYTATFCIGTVGCSISSRGLLVRVNPIYADTVIGASGSTALPQQGITITSIGTSDTNTQRKVTVFQGYPEVPAEFFPYILFQP